MTPLKDPLAGQREEVGNGERDTLVWEMVTPHDACPVEVGQTFELRRSTIEITKVERVRRGGKRHWIALFTRYWKSGDKPHLIAANGDGYTSDPKRALRLGEEVFDGESEERSDEHKNAGEPLEPEAVAPHEIKNYRGSRDAHQRFQLELGAERVALQDEPLELRLARLRAESRGRHVDISSDLKIIEDRIGKAERKLERAA